jgi:hypothetical protein
MMRIVLTWIIRMPTFLVNISLAGIALWCLLLAVPV